DLRPHVASLIPLHAGSRFGLLAAAARLADWLRERDIDLVHGQLVRSHLVARLAARAVHVPMVTTWQNTGYGDAPAVDFGGASTLRWFMCALDRAPAPYDRRFIAVSDHVARHWTEVLGVPSDRVTVVHNAVDAGRYAEPDPVAV